MSDNGTAYCIRCGKKTEYSIKLQRVRVNVCGVRFSYIAICLKDTRTEFRG